MVSESEHKQVPMRTLIIVMLIGVASWCGIASVIAYFFWSKITLWLLGVATFVALAIAIPMIMQARTPDYEDDEHTDNFV